LIMISPSQVGQQVKRKKLIALVSEVFEGDRMADKDKIRKITLAVSSEIEVVPFPPNEFNEQNPFAREILQTGIKLV